jgi:hypothetical protein
VAFGGLLAAVPFLPDTSAARVTLPTIPSTGRPALRWNFRTSASVAGPKLLFSRCGGRPRFASRNWSTETSKPTLPRRSVRTPNSGRPYRPRAMRVCLPTLPSAVSLRSRWNATIARFVIGPARPSIGPL